MKRRGTTLAELLVAGGLLLLLTALVTTALIYGFQRGDFHDKKHDSLQQFAVFRERLQVNLKNARIDLSNSNATQIRYVLPSRGTTPIGELNIVSEAEQIVWNDLDVFEVSLHTLNGKHQLQKRLLGAPDQTQVLWNLGELPASINIDLSKLPVLRFSVTGQDRAESPPWTRTVLMVVDNYL